MGERSQRTALTAHDAGGYAFGILFWVGIWFAVAAFIGNGILLAGPVETLRALAENITEPAFWMAIGATSARILLTGTLASIAGAALGALSYRLPLIERLFAPALQVMKSAPVACVIVIVLVAWGASGALIVIVAFVAFPPFYVSTAHALAERPRATEDVLRLMGVSRWRIFLCCTWPAALPFLTTASKTAVALSWRAGITAELLCLPLGSIGSAVYTSKLTLDSGELLVWTIMVMLLSWLTEQVVLALLRLSRRTGAAALDAQSTPAAGAAEVGAVIWDRASKAFGGTSVIRELSLTIAPGERVCLMAPTGSGKTTALGLALGRITPDSGEVRVPAAIGTMLQTPTLVEELTAVQNVMLAAAPAVTADEAERILETLLPLPSTRLAPPELSGGMKRLTELVRALLSPSQALILDEPFAGLDRNSRLRACELIRRYQNGRPVIIATHDPEDAAFLDAEIRELPEAAPGRQAASASDPRKNGATAAPSA